LRPDSEERQPSIDFINTLQTTKRMFQLQDPDVAKDGDKVGTWTMVYDEGFEVAVDNFTFFAFSRFELVPDESAPDGHRNISHCGETQVGWYHDKARQQWGCYVGKKVNSTKGHRAALVQTRSHRFPGESSSNEKVPSGGSTSSSMLAEAHMLLVDVDSHGYDDPLPEEWHKNVADALNLLQLSWKARAYPHLVNKTARTMNKNAGLRRNVPHSSKKLGPHKAKAFLEIVEDLPASLDWGNKEGRNYLDSVITQGDCGSCYSISTLRMLSARNRVRAGNPKAPPFSITFPLYCSEYNQGCGGGYGFLESKWSEDVGLIPETCAPYNQMGTCQLDSKCDLGSKRYRAANHRYVGGFYGATDSQLVASELAAGGPLVMSFEPKEDFMYYEKGIYQSVPNKIHQEWEQVDHAVLLVGYGEENGKKYWLLQNSWGTDWGEKGYFRMIRGQDESGCESIVVAAEVVEESNNPVLDDFLSTVEIASMN
jgi:cathepsin C